MDKEQAAGLSFQKEMRRRNQMDLEDLIKGKHHKHGHRHDDYHDNHGNAYKHKDKHFSKGYRHGNYKLEMLRSFLGSLPHKKALLTGAIIFGVFILIIGIAILWMLFPLIIKLLGYVEANGIQGVVNYVLSLLQLFWKGNG